MHITWYAIDALLGGSGTGSTYDLCMIAACNKQRCEEAFHNGHAKALFQKGEVVTTKYAIECAPAIYASMQHLKAKI
jgi:hypothetical protein